MIGHIKESRVLHSDCQAYVVVQLLARPRTLPPRQGTSAEMAGLQAAQAQAAHARVEAEAQIGLERAAREKAEQHLEAQTAARELAEARAQVSPLGPVLDVSTS